MIKLMKNKLSNKIIFQFSNRWKEKSFLLGTNININKDFGYREVYLCLYLGFWSLFVGFKNNQGGN